MQDSSQLVAYMNLREMTSSKLKIQKVGDNVTAIKDNLDSLKSDMIKLGSRTYKAEARFSHLEIRTLAR